MKDLTKIKTPLGLLPKKTQARLRAAMDAGEVIEWFSGGRWVVRGEGFMLYPKTTYRVRPKPEPTKDSIDWSHVSDEINFVARDDSSGDSLWGYSKRPDWFNRTESWRTDNGLMVEMNAFASYKRGTCEAKDSLLVRPEYDGE